MAELRAESKRLDERAAEAAEARARERRELYQLHRRTADATEAMRDQLAIERDARREAEADAKRARRGECKWKVIRLATSTVLGTPGTLLALDRLGVL